MYAASMRYNNNVCYMTLLMRHPIDLFTTVWGWGKYGIKVIGTDIGWDIGLYNEDSVGTGMRVTVFDVYRLLSRTTL